MSKKINQILILVSSLIEELSLIKYKLFVFCFWSDLLIEESFALDMVANVFRIILSQYAVLYSSLRKTGIQKKQESYPTFLIIVSIYDSSWIWSFEREELKWFVISAVPLLLYFNTIDKVVNKLVNEILLEDSVITGIA